MPAIGGRLGRIATGVAHGWAASADYSHMLRGETFAEMLEQESASSPASAPAPPPPPIHRFVAAHPFLVANPQFQFRAAAWSAA
jgi:hypothetical protein